MNKKINISILICTTLMANSADMSDFDALLKDATQKITESKLNIDYTPSVISVLKHEQLSLLGVKTLFEALSLLPGVETSINQVGIKKVIIRGFDNPNNFTFDKAKLLIDGVSIEMGIFGNSSFYLNLPIDVISRIEVLRGPGSALYGTGALNGVINVVTTQHAKSGDSLFFAGGSDEYLMGGVRKHYDLDDKTELYADVYYQKHNRRIEVDKSYMPSNQIMDPNTGELRDYTGETKTQENLNDYALAFAMKYQNWSFQTRLKNEIHGNYYGWNERLEEDVGNETKQQHFFAEIGYEDYINNSTKIDTKIGYSYFKMYMYAQDFYNVAPTVGLPYNFSIKESEQRFTFESEIQSNTYDNHNIIGGIYLQTLQELQNKIDDTLSPYGERALFEEGIQRDVVSGYLRDTIDITDELSTLVALRFDYYTKEEKFYPSAQFGLVYIPLHKWNFKLNYGHAFRVPSWVEQYSIEYGEGDGTRPGNPDLNAETSDTFEAVVIYKNLTKHHVQANIYYSILNDVIDIDDSVDPGGYINYSQRSSYGGELAYTFIPYLQNQFHINISYNETEYKTPDLGIEQSMAGVAKFMLKAYYIHYLTSNISASALVKHIGERPRHQDSDNRDENDPIDPYTTLDLTMNLISSHHWNFHLSAKNVFDADVRYPSYYSRHNGGNIRQGRNYMLQGEYKF
jgi:iron complex outermembrane receptor protein